MERIYASPSKTLIVKVVNQSVVTRSANGRPRVRTFRNRYTLRKFLSTQISKAKDNGFVSVNR